MSASGRKRASSCTAAALLGRFFLVEQRRQIDRVGEGDAVEDRGGVVADPEHQAAQAAFGLGQAILAMFVRIARRTGDERERAACQADEVAIADVDRGQGELIAAVAPALRDEQAFARHFGQDHGQEFGRDILRIRNVRELHLPLAPMVGKVLERTDRIAGLLREHGGVTVTRSEEHTSELQSLMRISYAVFCLKKKNKKTTVKYTRR